MFDSRGLAMLGFESFVEAFNVLGFALGAKPASIKNYRDEFDPRFDNGRVGWHKRPMRDYCRAIYERYKGLDIGAFTGLVKAMFGNDDSPWLDPQPVTKQRVDASTFAQRLATGLAAERYFETAHPSIPEFSGLLVENTTHLGCGYDFRLHSEPMQDDFLVVEVKGLMELTGGISMTPKEHDVASSLRDRFILFVVKNFREAPSHTIFRDPLSCGLEFKKVEKVTVQVSWSTTV
jgi:hypothetical protein